MFAFLLLSSTANAHWPWNNHSHRVIGYRPHISWLPQGTTLNVNGVYVDPYRRSVTIGINAQFYHIPQVRTYNFYNGQQNTFNHNWRK